MKQCQGEQADFADIKADNDCDDGDDDKNRCLEVPPVVAPKPVFVAAPKAP